MKKFSYALLFAAALAFTACESNQTNNDDTHEEMHDDSVNRENVLDEADKMLNDTADMPEDTMEVK